VRVSSCIHGVSRTWPRLAADAWKSARGVATRTPGQRADRQRLGTGVLLRISEETWAVDKRRSRRAPKGAAVCARLGRWVSLLIYAASGCGYGTAHGPLGGAVTFGSSSPPNKTLFPCSSTPHHVQLSGWPVQHHAPNALGGSPGKASLPGWNPPLVPVDVVTAGPPLRERMSPTVVPVALATFPPMAAWHARHAR
jgi:hypothetical protein